MKKLLLLLFSICLLQQELVSQQSNIWYFGHYAGLDFNGSSPQILTDGKINTNEGSATVCDADGKLLFYTDGVKIWDSKHVHINPSEPLHGNSSSSQSSVIVPKPGNNSRFYIFTQDEHGLLSCQNGLNYSEVEVSGTTVKLLAGAVNIKLFGCNESTEKISATLHSNGYDYWIITVKQNGDFISWPVTAAGVGAPVISPIKASVDIGPDDRVGYLKLSAKGDLLLLGRRKFNSINELFEFDNSSGKVTKNRGMYHQGTIYGAEFSPSGKNFFVSGGFSRVYQFRSDDFTQKVVIGNSTWSAALQLAPDGNIYVATGYENQNSDHLDMVSDLESFPATYTYKQIVFPGGHYSRLGLPNTSVKMIRYAPTAITVTDTCEHDSTRFTFSPKSADSVLWDFGEPGSEGNNFSRKINPAHRFSSSGVFTIKLIKYGFPKNDTSFRKLTIIARPVFDLGRDTVLCPGESLLIDSKLKGTDWNFLWNNGETKESILVSSPGTYKLQVSQACPVTDSMRVFLDSSGFDLDLGPDSNLCKGPLLLNLKLKDVVYLWDNGSNDSSYLVKEGGLYHVLVKSKCHSKYDSIRVEDCICHEPRIANAFSPNKDNHNDSFAPFVCKFFTEHYHFSIYNRWGEMVFRSDLPGFAWDGNYKGNAAPEGVYLWILHYDSPDGRTGARRMSGTVSLLR